LAIWDLFKPKKQAPIQAMVDAGGQAVGEGYRDITTTYITQKHPDVLSVVDKNNYRTYAAQVNQIYLMFNGRTPYGSEILHSLLRTMLAFICGEGVSFTSENKATKDYIERFFKCNMIDQYIFQMVRAGIMEGKHLTVLNKSKDKDGDPYIMITSFLWWVNRYTVWLNDYWRIEEIKYKPQRTAPQEKTINLDSASYVQFGGTPADINNTPHKLHLCLTQIENASRGIYDLRKNAHIFGNIFPAFETQPGPQGWSDAERISKTQASNQWKVGHGFAGPAKVSIIAPPSGGSDVLKEDILMNFKLIATATGHPIHWLGWPELLNSRATAENFLEMVESATAEERRLWEWTLEDIVRKSMTMAIDAGFESNDIIDDFDIKLPMLSIKKLEMVQQVWLPLMEANIISEDTMRNLVPGIDPIYEKKMLDKEKKEKAKDSPFNNNAMKNAMDTKGNPIDDSTQTNNYGYGRPKEKSNG
jgi:hypothetical protein